MTPPAERAGTRQTATDAAHILVVGGGIAGLTAALRLAERDYRVTLVEKKVMLGGNLASRTVKGGQCLDVYPHMFQAWYENFWGLMADVHEEDAEKGNQASGKTGGKQPEPNAEPLWKRENFRPFSKVFQAQPMADGKTQIAGLTRPYSAAHLVENLFSGVAPPADMFLFGYASLDLMAELRNPTLKLENVSLTGYLSSRVYMTQTALEAYEAFVLRVWGIPAYMISATDCQAYAAYCYATADEDGYLSTGAAEENVIDPIVEKLATFTMTNGEPAVSIEIGCEVTRVALKKASGGNDCYRVHEVEWRKPDNPPPRPPETVTAPVRQVAAGVDYDDEEPTGVSVAFAAEVPKDPIELDGFRDVSRKDFDSVVLAVPPNVLSTLARRRPSAAGEKRIVDAIPALAELNRVGSAPIPVLHLYLNKQLDIPRDPVALNGSELSLAFTDISKNWKKLSGPGTVLALSCSEPIPLTGPYWQDDAFAMISELSAYLPFEPGTEWGLGGDVDWGKTMYDTNADAQLSLNSVGSDRWRPETSYPTCVKNLFFAGDYCKHDYGITTIEGAVATGVKAAAAVRQKEGRLGAKIELAAIELLPSEVFVGMRYAWLTTALAAMGWSKLTTPSEVAARAKEAEKEVGSDPFELLAKGATLRYLLTPGLPARGTPPAPGAEAQKR